MSNLPSAPAIVEEAKKFACIMHDDYDPVTVRKCKSCNKSLASADKLVKAKKILDELGAPVTTQSVSMYNPDKAQHIQLNSVRDTSTGTVNYWIQYPVLNVHLQMALCAVQDLPVTSANMEESIQRFPLLYEQLQKIVRDNAVMASCEQVDPIFMEMVVKALVLQGYGKVEPSAPASESDNSIEPSPSPTALPAV